MKKVYIFLLIAIVSRAGVFDFYYIYNAEKNYKHKKYHKAIDAYTKVDKSEYARYNLANSYYKAKEYKKAINVYKKIKNKKLQFQKLYNMGNSYAKIKKIDTAINSYKMALKIKKDKDAMYNLALLVKHKKRKKKEIQNKKRGNERGSKKQRDSKGDKDSLFDKKGDENGLQNAKGRGEGNRGAQNQNKNTIKDKITKEIKIKHSKIDTNLTISDMEERKYSKIVNKRGIRTLMIPLSEKGKDTHEKNY